MSIEDIDYLIENSVQNSASFFIDSNGRDRIINPNPSSFTLSFSEPIKNVYGFEILDATIPVTMYNVDSYNNIFAYSHVFYNTGSTSTDFSTYFEELQYVPKFNDLYDANSDGNVFISINKANYDTVVSYQNTIGVVTLSNHMILYRELFTGLTITTDSSLTDVNSIEFINNGTTYYIISSSTNLDTFILNNSNINIVYKNNTTAVVYIYQYVSFATVVHWLVQYKTNVIKVWDIYVANMFLELEIGNYDGTSFFQFMDVFIKDQHKTKAINSFEETTLSVAQVSQYGTLAKQYKMKFNYNSAKANSFILDMKKSTSRSIIGFSGYANDGFTDLYQIISRINNNQLFMSIIDPLDPNIQYVEPEGIINLQGIRYILLRVPEIESHYLNSFGYGSYTPGLGMFKLAASNDVTYLRFDFVNLINKPFHPIGKLSKITLQFTLDNGELYDFKGVDYNLLITVKYYSPKPKRRIIKSILNPNYDPDFLAYSTKEHKKDVITQYNENEILREQNKYDYEDPIDD
jgi:hypothetical protein